MNYVFSVPARQCLLSDVATKLGTFVNFMCVYKCPMRSQ